MKKESFLRYAFLLGAYAAVIFASLGAGYLLRFEFHLETPLSRIFREGLLVAGITLPCLAVFGQFRAFLSYFSIPDALRIFWACLVANGLLLAAWQAGLGFHLPPRSVLLMNLVFSFAGITAVRLGFRMVRERNQARRQRRGKQKKVGLYGAGDAGSHLLEEILSRPGAGMEVAALFDDDTAKWGTSLHGLPVLGGTEALVLAREEERIEEVILAMPTISRERLAELVALCRRQRLPVRSVPSLGDLLHRHVQLGRIRPVQVEDLLARDPAQLSDEKITEWLRGQSVLITGAGGTIGSELSRQVWACHPRQLVLVDRSEAALHLAEERLREDGAGPELIPTVADAGDEGSMRTLLGRHQIQVIFHAAAHKHVPIMETQVAEALRNNTWKTERLGVLALEAGVEKFIFISTDKAINPTSVMGVSKRLAEIALQGLSRRGGTRFLAVRFGNVLGSSGSVIPKFRRQLERGGPLTVTHPEVTRYFMSPMEAVGLVLQAGRLGEGGEIFILEMGAPVRIADMARQLVELSGFQPDRDVEIRFTGLRPGEKLFEELAHEQETTEATSHPKIWKLKKNLVPTEAEAEAFSAGLARLLAQADSGDAEGAKRQIQLWVPEYQPWFPRPPS